MKFATIDGSQFPIIWIKINPVNPSPSQIDKLFEELEEVLLSNEGKYIAITVTPPHIISSDARVRLGNHSKEFYNQYKAREIVSILVITSPIASIMLQTVQLLFRPFSQRQIIVRNEIEAENLAQEHLQRESSIS